MFHNDRITNLSPNLWLQLFFIGLSLYVIGNGALYWGLMYIQATTASLLLSFIPLLVLIAGMIWLQEMPTHLQVTGVLIVVIGSLLFFSVEQKAGEILGIAIVVLGLAGNAVFGILGRKIARDNKVDTLTLTAVPLAFGSCLLIPVALSVEGIPGFSLTGCGMVLGLAVFNTVFAYVLYNHALKVLPAFELSTILNLTPLVTAIWAWLFLNERLSIVQILGMITVVVGVVVVQLHRKSGEAG
jgi:drug/metabolite transporter (DMT)-like permease